MKKKTKQKNPSIKTKTWKERMIIWREKKNIALTT